MIDEDRTMQLFLYTSDELVSGSHKPVVVVCEGCGTPRVVQRRRHKEADLCVGCALIKRWDASGARERQGAIVTKRYEDPLERAKTSIAIKKAYDETPELRVIQLKRTKRTWSDPDLRERQSVTQKKRWEDPILREQRSVLSKKMWSDPELRDKARERGVKRFEDPAERERTSIAMKRVWESTELREKASLRMTQRFEDPVEREKTSAASQGIPYDEWEGFAMNSPYCPKFDEACRESNREKYDRRCFLSDITEEKNGKKLSVHHIDMNKQQGCDGYAWKLVPLSVKWHNRVHTSLWMARIQYLLTYVWNPGRNNVVS